MSSTTSKRLARVWGIVNGAYETGAHMVSVAYLEAALEGGEKWAALESIYAQAPMEPEEYRAVWHEALCNGEYAVKPFGPDMTPDAYEVWYGHEVDRLDSEVQNILSTNYPKEKK